MVCEGEWRCVWCVKVSGDVCGVWRWVTRYVESASTNPPVAVASSFSQTDQQPLSSSVHGTRHPLPSIVCGTPALQGPLPST